MLDILAETGLIESKPMDTPIDLNEGLVLREGEPFSDPGRYRRLAS